MVDIGGGVRVKSCVLSFPLLTSSSSLSESDMKIYLYTDWPLPGMKKTRAPSICYLFSSLLLGALVVYSESKVT